MTTEIVPDVEIEQHSPSALDLPGLAEAINDEHAAVENAFRKSVAHAVEAGRLLNEAKERVEYGEWTGWIEDNCEVAPRTARLYMRVADELPELREEDRQHVADLPLSAVDEYLREANVDGDDQEYQTIEVTTKEPERPPQESYKTVKVTREEPEDDESPVRFTSEVARVSDDDSAEWGDDPNNQGKAKAEQIDTSEDRQIPVPDGLGDYKWKRAGDVTEEDRKRIRRREPDATNAAADLAHDYGLSLWEIDGSGKDGRVLVDDVENTLNELWWRLVEERAPEFAKEIRESVD